MSVILNFSIFPTDKGDSVSPYVSRVIAMIRQSGVAYQLNPMGTSIETETMAQALAIVEKAHELLVADSTRIYSAITIDSRPGHANRLTGKIDAIEKHIGSVNH